MPSSNVVPPAPPDAAAGAQAGTARRRARRPSATRTYFLRAVSAQLHGARLLAIVAVAILVTGGAYWLAGTTGSPVIGVYFLVLGGVLVFTVYWFVQVMRMFTGRR